METIRQRSILQAVLLQTLAEHPAGLPIDVAYDLIDQHYRFPEEWYREIPDSSGYDEIKLHGYSDWREVPQELLVELVNTETQWQNEIRWARNDLRKQGFLDMTVPRGVWKLSAAGTHAAGSHPEEQLTTEEQRVLSSSREETRWTTNPSEPGVETRGRRRDLTMRLQALTKSMPLSDLNMLVEIARVVRKRSLPGD
jgi:hypothetical protein